MRESSLTRLAVEAGAVNQSLLPKPGLLHNMADLGEEPDMVTSDSELFKEVNREPGGSCFGCSDPALRVT